MSFKVIVAGSRTFNDYPLLESKLDHILKNKSDIEIVSGQCRGADILGEFYASEKGYKTKYFPADWEKWGKGAGFRRNREMALYADALVAFWDGKSRGTQCMIEFAKGNNLLVRIILF